MDHRHALLARIYVLHAHLIDMILQWETIERVKAHSSAVSAMGIQDEYFVTGSSDASVKTWKLSIDVHSGMNVTDKFMNAN